MNRILTTTFVLLSVFSASAQMTINNGGYTVTQMVDGLLVPSGSGTVVSAVNFRGCMAVNSPVRYQLGAFTTAGTTAAQMGFTQGIVLSTGNTAHIPLTPGVNPGSVAQMSTLYTSGTSGEIRGSNSAAGQDTDADVLIDPENYYNAAILEFNFIPVSSDMSFRYIFGSEEYDDQSGPGAINYNCSAYHDKFAFLLSGPGIAGGQGYLNNAINIARLPNNSEVGINSVNNGVVGSSGGAPNAANCLGENPAWTTSPTPQFLGFIDGTNLNGNTRILTASYSGLTPGLTYKIRLVLADAKDGGYDSVVYLEAGSFTTTPTNLPAELIDFEGSCEQQGDELNWMTGSERNNSFFEIERSVDGQVFVSLDTIFSQGDSDLPSYYSYTAPANFAEVNYYRLSQQDYNGSRTILKTIAVQNDCRSDAPIVSYDAATHSLVIETSASDLLAVIIYSAAGQLLAEQHATQAQTSLTIPMTLDTKNAVWLVRVQEEHQETVHRICVLN